MTTSSRVSAFWPGIIFLIWWAVDVTFAWTRSEDKAWAWITIQRVIVHIAAFILFVGGSVVKGESLLIKLLGIAFVLATFWGGVRWAIDRKQT